MTASLIIFGPRTQAAQPPVTRNVFLTTDEATASFAFVPLLSLVIPTSEGSELLIVFTMSGDTQGAANRTGKFRLLVDGTPLIATGETFRQNRTGSASLNIRTTGLAAGSHTVAIEWARDSGPPGQLRINAASDADEHHASLSAQEVRP